MLAENKNKFAIIVHRQNGLLRLCKLLQHRTFISVT